MADKLTRKVIASMLKENTGVHVLDSGGAYGRHWERNQLRSFEDEPYAVVDFRYNSIDYTLNVYHWLVERVTYDYRMQARFTNYRRLHDPDYDNRYGKSDYEMLPGFLESLGAVGLYGDGGPMSENTYNHESLLSQTIQYTYFEVDNTAYIALQIHGGCDVRGGYTDIKIFQTSDEIFFDQDGTIFCDNCDMSWHTDDGYHWYQNDDNSLLNSYPIIDQDDLTPEQAAQVTEQAAVCAAVPDCQLALLPDANYHPVHAIDFILVDEDGKGHCPHCGGLLLA